MPTKLIVARKNPMAHRDSIVGPLVRAAVLCVAGVKVSTTNQDDFLDSEFKQDVLKTFRSESFAFEWGEHEDTAGPEFPVFTLRSDGKSNSKSDGNLESDAVKQLLSRLRGRRSVLLYPTDDSVDCLEAMWCLAASAVAELLGRKPDEVWASWKRSDEIRDAGFALRSKI
jgi:hypothetical protein